MFKELTARRIEFTGILDPVDQRCGHTSIKVYGTCEWPQNLKIEDAVGVVCQVMVRQEDMTTNYPIHECKCYMTFQDSGEKAIIELNLDEDFTERVHRGTARILWIVQN